MRRLLAVTIVVSLAMVGLAPGVRSHAAASAQGFEFPESAYWDGPTGSFYVSNFGGSTLDPNGREADGYISRLDGEGRVVAAKWVTGLRSPKGIRRVGDRLYVADAGQLVVIDIAGASIAATVDLDAIGAQLPNDVALDQTTGDVYVTDMFRNALYRFPSGSLTPEVFLESPDLESPNGLLVDGDHLVVASFGRDLDRATFTPQQPGRVLTVDLATKEIAPLGAMQPVGQLDGIERWGDRYLVTDNPGGRVLAVAVDGTVAEIATDMPGAADLGFREGDGVAAVPQLGAGVVRFVTVAP